MTAIRTTPQPGDISKLYAAVGTGDLADDLVITIKQRTQNSTTPGIRVCESASNYPTTVFSGTVAAFKATMGTFATGWSWADGGTGTGNTIEIMATLTLPASVDANLIMGDTGQLALAFENQGS